MIKACISKEQLVKLALCVAKNPDLFPDPMPRELFVRRVKELVGAELTANAVTPTARLVGVRLAIASKGKGLSRGHFYRTIRENNEAMAAKVAQMEQHAMLLRDIVDKLIHRVLALETKLKEILS